MTYLETIELGETIAFWTNTITLGLFRFAVIIACFKYIWS